jgi:PST family polysaccharide transporter
MTQASRRTLALGFASQVASRLGIMAVSLVSTAVLARLLAPAEFGIMGVAMAVTALADAIFDGAFAINIIHKEDLSDEYVATALNVSILFAAALALALLATADLWQALMGFPKLAAVLKLMSVTLLLKAGGAVSRNILVRQRRLHALSISAMCGALTGTLGTACGMALLGFGIWSLVWGAIVSVTIETAINIAQARPHFRLSLSSATAREVLGSGSLYTASQFLNWGMNSGSSMISARMLGTIEFGLYSRGSKLLELTTSAIGQPMMRVFFPSFARARGDLAAARTMLIQALSASSFVFAIASALLAVHSRLLVGILLGSKWERTATVGQILFLSLLPRCCYKITESAAFGLGAAALAVKRQAVFAAVALCAVGIGARWGIVGVAVGAGLGIWIIYLVSLAIAAHLVNAPMWRMVSLHLAPIAFAVCVGLADKLATAAIAHVYVGAAELVSELFGLCMGLTSAMLLALAMPNTLLPQDLVRMRARLTTRMRVGGSLT